MLCSVLLIGLAKTVLGVRNSIQFSFPSSFQVSHLHSLPQSLHSSPFSRMCIVLNALFTTYNLVPGSKTLELTWLQRMQASELIPYQSELRDSWRYLLWLQCESIPADQESICLAGGLLGCCQCCSIVWYNSKQCWWQQDGKLSINTSSLFARKPGVFCCFIPTCKEQPVPLFPYAACEKSNLCFLPNTLSAFAYINKA